MSQPSPAKKNIVVVDDDRDVAELVQTILIDEGFAVSCLYDLDKRTVEEAIDSLKPDCVLLDGAHRTEYGYSWDIAKALSARASPIPVVMLTGHTHEGEEAVLDTSERAKDAHFAAVISKPFDIDRLVDVVRGATGAPHSGDERNAAVRRDQKGLEKLMARLAEAGAKELQTSSAGREWATFRVGPDRTLYKIYRWRAADVYFVGRYSSAGDQMHPLGEFYSLEGVIDYCVARVREDKL